MPTKNLILLNYSKTLKFVFGKCFFTKYHWAHMIIKCDHNYHFDNLSTFSKLIRLLKPILFDFHNIHVYIHYVPSSDNHKGGGC